MNIKFKLLVSQVKKNLASIFQTVNSTSVLPVLEYVLVTVEAGRISFHACDLENFNTLFVQSEFQGEGGIFLIHAKALKNFLNNALDDSVDFHITDKIKVASGGFSLTLGDMEKVDNYPKQRVIGDAPKVILVDSKEIVPFIKNAIPFLSHDDLRPSMTGVYIHDHKGQLMIAATDAHRLYWTSIMKTPECFKSVSFIIPPKACKLIVSQFKDNQPLEISVGVNDIKILGNKYALTSRLIDARYPDYQVVIPDNDLKFDMKRKQLAAFLKLAANFTHSMTNQLKLVLNKDCIKVGGGDMDFDEIFEYSLPIYNLSKELKEPVTFAVNCKFLSEALMINANDEYVKINHSGLATKAFIIDDVVLLMPLMMHE